MGYLASTSPIMVLDLKPPAEAMLKALLTLWRTIVRLSAKRISEKKL
jgi:hypothetical protein